MKGQFFIVFMIVTSCLTVISTLLWQYIRRDSRKAAAAVGVLAVTAVTVGELWIYGTDYGSISQTAWYFPTFYGAMFSLSWLFMFVLAFPVLAIGAICCFIYRLFHKRINRKRQRQPSKCVGMSRRTFLKGTAAAVPLLAFGTSSFGIFNGERDLATTVHTLHFAALPDTLEGYRIGQISDSHMGLFFSPARLQEAVQALLKEKANRLVITGDLIDELSLLPQCREILRNASVQFPDGIDFIYGNHEYYRGIKAIRSMLKEANVRILRNSNYKAADGPVPFYIAGVDYSFARGDEAFAKEREEYVEQALDGIPDNAFVLMLAHHPDFIDEAFRHHVPLILCGHTHGGQFAPIGPIVQAVGFKYLRGMFEQNGCYGYVSRGTGHWLPLRVACSREVSVFELHTC